MRHWRLIWKDVQIFREWHNENMMNDIKSFLNKTKDKTTYISPFRYMKKSVRSVLKKPKYHVYLAFIFLVISVATFDWKVQLLAFFLLIILYYRKIWVDGTPLKFYKDKYFNKKDFVE